MSVPRLSLLIGSDAPFSATGGTITTDGAYTVHTFTTDDTLVCSGTVYAEVLVQAAGGGASWAGGGAGGHRTATVQLSGTMPVTVGDGGLGGDTATVGGATGGDSTFAGLTAKGGGGGDSAGASTGAAGGSGGGRGNNATGWAASPAGQGNAGGGDGGHAGAPYPTGGGGGASGIGGSATSDADAGNGGPGVTWHGDDYAGGGAGACWGDGNPGVATHGGGNAGDFGIGGADATPNTGGGGGGAGSTRTGGDGGKGVVVARYLTPTGVAALDLGWQEFADVAVLGNETRAMPGGDGSLEFTIPGVEAGKLRNVLAPGAQVILDTGDDQWGGLIVGDPMAGYYAAQPVVSVAAAGLWSHAANRRDVAYVWCDSDPTQWFRIRQYFDDVAGEMVDYIDQGKFAIDTEGRLLIRGDADRTFHEGSYAALAYWLAKGVVDSGCRIVGVDISYKSQMPADWMGEIKSYLGSPWGAADDFGNVEWTNGTTRTAWTSPEIDLEAPSRSLLLSLDDFTATGSPAVDPFVKARTVVVRCRMDGASVDRAVTLDKAMCDLATLTGLATVTRSETLGAARDQLAIRPEFEKSVADGLRELAALHAAPVEHYFDRAAGAWRFTCNELPAVVDPARNRHWVIDDKRPGENTSGVVRDPEAAPEYLRVTYLSSGVASIPDGQPRSYCYPSEPTDFTSNVGVSTDRADVKLTDAEAADVAARLHGQMSVAAFSGSAVLPQTALTVAGQELPSRLMRPGDRVNIMGREGATDLYVSETSYDWASGQMSVTVGWPFEIVAQARKR